MGQIQDMDKRLGLFKNAMLWGEKNGNDGGG